MNLKNRTALTISIFFTLVFAISGTVIYLLFYQFRKDEFENRLKEKAISSIKLLVEVEQIDRQLLKLIDQNSINKLYDEKTLIFDEKYQLIYSSLDDTKIKWTVDELKALKSQKSFFRKENEHEVYGFYYDTNQKDYYALVSANDNYGKRKLQFLLYILIFTNILIIVFIWLLSYGIIKKLLNPLDQFHKSISRITEKNLESRIQVKKNKDEIDLLAVEFNQMLERINQSYKKQQEFTANASHELRTPLARLSAQLENKIQERKENHSEIIFFDQLLKDVNQLSELTHSLLLLSKLENESDGQNDYCRIDELIFDVFEKNRQFFPDLKIDFNIDHVEDMEVKGNKALLEIAFSNLLKNAYLYAANKCVQVTIKEDKHQIAVIITNDGETLSVAEQQNLFEPFMRGNNSKKIPGLGLGLRIVKRILAQQKATIEYAVSLQNKNVFTVVFKESD